ncbi:MAG: hypothetical protein FWE97_03215 [Dehalococcoidia bacterium]|nr:hypothetical protein [Dehalococcoidia bacterium]
MSKRHFLLALHAFVAVSLLCTSCEDTHSAKHHTNTIAWNGFNLALDYLGDHSSNLVDITIHENVLPTTASTLTISITSMGSAVLEYGIDEFIQVYLSGLWYTIPVQLSQRKLPLEFKLPAGNTKEYAIDFSVLGSLPPGKYRFCEKLFQARLQSESYAFAYFWITEPGAERPPESETTGPARMEDIVFYVESFSAARDNITDKDYAIFLSIKNLSGKLYHATKAMLEMKQGNQWIDTEYQHTSLGSVPGWTSRRKMFFLSEPLAEGVYRLKLSMEVFGINDTMEHEYEFTVFAHKNTPQPQWEASRLAPSRFNEQGYNSSVSITLKNTVLNTGTTWLVYTVTASNYYSFGRSVEIEVLLDGKWYRVPMAHNLVLAIQINIAPGGSITHYYDPVFYANILPEGRYRMIMDFNLVDIESNSREPTYLAKEYAMAEFTVAQTLETWI